MDNRHLYLARLVHVKDNRLSHHLLEDPTDNLLGHLVCPLGIRLGLHLEVPIQALVGLVDIRLDLLGHQDNLRSW